MSVSTRGVLAAAHTGITVSDLERAISFYRDVMGFPVDQPVECKGEVFDTLTGVAGTAIKVARVSVPGHTLELVQYMSPASRDTSKAQLYEAGTMHLAFQVEDIESVVAAMSEAGVEPVHPVQTVLEGPRARDRKSVV